MPILSTATSRRGLRGAGVLFSGAVALLLAARPWAAAPPTLAPPVAAVALAYPYQPAALRLAAPTGRPAVAAAAPIAADTSARGLAAVLADLRRRSYFLETDAPASTGRVAGNLRQGLSARIAPASYTVMAAVPQPQAGRAAPDTPALKPAWQVNLTLRGIGRAGSRAFRPAAAPTVVAATDTSVRYQHGAAFATEYVNTPAGVRQNYYLARRPTGHGGPVQVTLALTTGLRPTASPDGQALSFASPEGGAVVLRYAGLRAWDATGRVLPARLRLSATTALALEVDDAEATYPLTIDPLLSTPSNRLDNPNNATNDFFGYSVAGAGDVNGDGYADVLVGAFGTANGGVSRGSTYLYLGAATGLGTTPGTTAGTYQRLDAPVTTDYDNFGHNVAGAGDVNGDGYADVLIGAYGAANGGTTRGSAYLYLGSATGLGTSVGTTAGTYQRLDNPNDADYDNFGQSVAGAGDVNGDGYADVIIGANGTGNGGTTRGSAYLYLGSAAGVGTTPGTTAGTYQRLNDPANANNNQFAIGVAGVGDVNGDGYADVIIGANGTANGGLQRGSAYLYLGSAAGLGTTLGTTAGTYQRLNDPNNANNDNFGYSVAGAGDVNGDGYADVLIGALGTSNFRGSAYVYLGSATGLGTAPGTTAGTYQRLNDPAAMDGDFFSISVAGAGDVNGDGYADVLIGASGTGNGGSNRGSAYLYSGSATGLGTTVGTTAGTYQRFNDPANADNDNFSLSVAGAGDVNGDGYADVIIGASGTAIGSTARGSAYLYLGSTGPVRPASATRRLNDPNNGNYDYFGFSVAGAGDVNGDGYADVIIGAYQTANGGTIRGSSYLYLGSATGLGTTMGTAAGTYQRLNNPNNTNNEYFGYSVAGAGDVNGDGYADVLIGAFGTANGGINRGSAYLYLGSATGLSTAPSSYQRFDNPNNTTSEYFGYSVAGAGDVNGDGYGDVVIGAYGTSNGGSFRGSAYVYLGSATGLGTTLGTTAGTYQRLDDPNNSNNDNFGVSVAGAGDVNGDGYGDVVIGAFSTSNGGTNRGSAYLYLGSATGLSTVVGTTAGTYQRLNDPNNADYDNFGFSVAGAGDVNGDGYADVIIGAYRTEAIRGSVYVYLGSATGLDNTVGTTAGTYQRFDNPNNTTSEYFGYSVAGAGDVNGDGYGDVVIGAYGTSNGGSFRGSAYVYLGSATGLGTTLGTTAGTYQHLKNPANVDSEYFGHSVTGAGDVNGDGYGDVLIGAYRTGNGGTQRGSAYLYGGNQADARPGGRLRLLNTDLSTPLSVVNKPLSQFGLGLTTRSVQGRVRARLVWEVVANGQPFSAGSTRTNSVQYTGRGPWTNVPLGGTELREMVSKAGRATKVRARLEYATSSPLAGTSPVAGTGGVGGQARYGPWQYVSAQQLGQSSSQATPLPVELTAFTAAPEGEAAVRLTWATASEVNSAAFVVERSLNGHTFAAVGTVAAAGSSESPRRYTLLDAGLPAGAAVLYYRLKQLDQDGTFSYSLVRAVTRSSTSPLGLTLTPNPTTGAATLRGAAAGALVQVYDAVGRLVLTATADAAGTAQLGLPAIQPAGVYVVRCGAQATRLVLE